MGMSIDFSSLSGFLCFCPDIPVKKTEELLTTADYLHRGQVIQTCVRKKTQFNKPARKMLYDILKKRVSESHVCRGTDYALHYTPNL